MSFHDGVLIFAGLDDDRPRIGGWCVRVHGDDGVFFLAGLDPDFSAPGRAPQERGDNPRQARRAQGFHFTWVGVVIIQMGLPKGKVLFLICYMVGA